MVWFGPVYIHLKSGVTRLLCVGVDKPRDQVKEKFLSLPVLTYSDTCSYSFILATIVLSIPKTLTLLDRLMMIFFF